MRRLFKLALVLTLVLFLLDESFAAEFVVGVSPPTVDLGEVKRGESKIVKFYIVTPSTETLIVRLEVETGSLDFFARDAYKNLLHNYSEETLTGWVEFLRNPVELAPANEALKTAAGEIRGWREVSFVLNVPANAEPGYHLAWIKPLPIVPPEVLGQAGARVVAITGVNMLFRVPGDAIRDGIILDVVPGSYVGDRLEINTFFQNTGSVTISARATQSIFKDGEVMANLSSSTETIKPNEVKVLKTFLPLDGISFGDYDVVTVVSYTTGLTEKKSTLKIVPPPVTIPEPEFPYWAIFLIVLIIAIAIGIYKWYK